MYNFVNNYQSALASAITSGATSLTLTTGTGAALGTIDSVATAKANNMFATLFDPSDSAIFEVIKLTSRSTDTLTVTRGLDGTSARDWPVGTLLDIRAPKILLEEFGQQGDSSWLAGSPQPGMSWIDTTANACFGSENGAVGLTGVSRASDSFDAVSAAPIGVVGFAYNDDSYVKTVWGGYFEGKKASGSGGQAYGVEVAITNNGATTVCTPYTAFGAADNTVGIVLESGGDATINPSSASASVGMLVANNGNTFGKGILFQNNALRDLTGTWAQYSAMELAYNQGIRWTNADGNRCAWISSRVTGSNKSLGLGFSTDAAVFVNDNDSAQFQIENTASATTILAATGGAGSAGTGTALLKATGSDTNGNIVYRTKGSGLHQFQYSDNTAQLNIIGVPSADHCIAIGGSAGGNPTIGTSGGGQVNVTSDLVLTGTLYRAAPVTETGATHTVATTTSWLICNRAGTITVTLPTPSSFPGRELTIKTITANTVVSASSNVVPLVGGAAGTAILAATAGKWATLVSDGTNWTVMAGA